METRTRRPRTPPGGPGRAFCWRASSARVLQEALGLTHAQAPSGDSIRVLGKGGKERMVPVLPVVREAIVAYITSCPYPLAADEALFRGARGGPLGARAIQRQMQKLRGLLGLPETATPHAMRHSFATLGIAEVVFVSFLPNAFVF